MRFRINKIIKNLIFIIFVILLIRSIFLILNIKIARVNLKLSKDLSFLQQKKINSITENIINKNLFLLKKKSIEVDKYFHNNEANLNINPLFIHVIVNKSFFKRSVDIHLQYTPVILIYKDMAYDLNMGKYPVSHLQTTDNICHLYSDQDIDKKSIFQIIKFLKSLNLSNKLQCIKFLNKVWRIDIDDQKKILLNCRLKKSLKSLNYFGVKNLNSFLQNKECNTLFLWKKAFLMF